LKPSIDRANGRTGKWTAVEDIKLKDAVKTHGSKNWGAISALIPGRKEKQCSSRWHMTLKPSNDRASARKCSWTTVEDSKLKDAVKMHGYKDWVAITALVPGRTKRQRSIRWHGVLKHSIDGANRRTGKWSEYEDSELKDAVQLHGGKDWDAIAALVPGRTEKQCSRRWQRRDVRVNGQKAKITN
jgi:hypothetical protein